MSGIGYKRTDSTGDIPVFQGSGKDIQLAQGGFLLDITGLTKGAILKAGTPMIFNESTRTAKALITGKVVEDAGASATAYKIAKGSLLKVGDNFAATVGGPAYAITSIDASNADYDTVTVGTTIGEVTADTMVFASSATGASNSSFGGVNGLLYRDQKVEENESTSIVIRATVYARRVPYSAALATALGPLIIYSQSF
ncbi:hypothetical protein [Parapedobacter indicus]|uniref:Uncharacterized protein n=1 Tax=Parapedobacter indicus TaxID=1477437 RepID=A0A1I3V632_9SPHI|nr:hypothetical protein [Parapedobacter indicus]PPK98981.1 hypothetical protein CLV26_11510 [Parapedobacter indicus]SFJ89647.1 hypothetical protein SAMN05444682_115167 [Parapedobacter indicus]